MTMREGGILPPSSQVVGGAVFPVILLLLTVLI